MNKNMRIMNHDEHELAWNAWWKKMTSRFDRGFVCFAQRFPGTASARPSAGHVIWSVFWSIFV
jgi:hypothetical protein